MMIGCDLHKMLMISIKSDLPTLSTVLIWILIAIYERQDHLCAGFQIVFPQKYKSTIMPTKQTDIYSYSYFEFVELVWIVRPTIDVKINLGMHF